MISRRNLLTVGLGLALPAYVLDARAAGGTGSSLETITTLQTALVDAARRVGKAGVV